MPRTHVRTNTPETSVITMRWAIRAVRLIKRGYSYDRYNASSLRQFYSEASDPARFLAIADQDREAQWSATLASRYEHNDRRASAGWAHAHYTEITICHDCDLPSWTCNLNGIHEVSGDSHFVCQPCLSDYSSCAYCSTYYRNEGFMEFTYVENYGDVCQNCLDDRFVYCEDCDGYVSEGHEHECNDCEAEFTEFQFPANGQGTIQQNESITIELPKGMISDEGMRAIGDLVTNSFYSEGDCSWDRAIKLGRVAEELEPYWQTKQGNFTKRLSAKLYKDHKAKMPPHLVSTIGNTAKMHTTDESAFDLEVTRDLNLPASAFAHEDSCWWQSYTKSRCMLKAIGGIGLRSFAKDDYYHHRQVTGRVWIVPLDKVSGRSNFVLAPTHDAVNADAFAVFNGYGDLSGIAAARLVAHLADMTYTKISIGAGDMYVNGERGYLVGPQEIIEKVEHVDIADSEWVHPRSRHATRRRRAA